MVRRCILLLRVGGWGFSGVLEGEEVVLKPLSKGANPAIFYSLFPALLQLSCSLCSCHSCPWCS